MQEINQFLRQLKHIYTPAFWLIAMISMYLQITQEHDVHVYAFSNLEILKAYNYLGIASLGPILAAIADFSQDFETGFFRRKMAFSMSRRIYISRTIHQIYLKTILRVFLANVSAILLASKLFHWLVATKESPMFLLIILCNVITELFMVSVILLLAMFIQSGLYSTISVFTLYLLGFVILNLCGQFKNYTIGRWLVFPFLYALKSESYTYRYTFLQLGLSLAATGITTFLLFVLFKKKDWSTRTAG